MVKTSRTIVGISLIFCILFGLILFSVNITQMRPTATNLAQQQSLRGLHVPGIHAQIQIIGNAAFASQASSQGWPGDGSPGAPYVISDYVIIDPSNPGIWIIGTTVHFIIENVTILWAYPTSGFNLDNVTNGELRNNTAQYSNAAFDLADSQNNILSDNIAKDSSAWGFGLHNSQNNVLFDNTATNSSGAGTGGFYLYHADNNNLTKNTATNGEGRGFDLLSSQNNLLSGNIATDNAEEGFHISGSYNTLKGNTATSNTLSGFKLQSCTLNNLIHNTATVNGNHGIYLLNTSQNILIYNTATNNVVNGFCLINASQNILIYNTATDNDLGLQLISSNYNTIQTNTLSPNSEGCIREFESVGNTFDGNICEEGGEVPGYNLATLIVMIAVISVIFFLRKTQNRRLNLY